MRNNFTMSQHLKHIKKSKNPLEETQTLFTITLCLPDLSIKQKTGEMLINTVRFQTDSFNIQTWNYTQDFLFVCVMRLKQTNKQENPKTKFSETVRVV